MNTLFAVAHEQVEDNDVMDHSFVEAFDMVEAIHIVMEAKGLKMDQVHEIQVASDRVLRKSGIKGKANA